MNSRAAAVPARQDRCIYTVPDDLCPGRAPLSDEHYLPRGLGNFRGFTPLANKICKECNGRFGGLEDVFLHSSPEAIFREFVGQVGRKRHRDKRIFDEPTFGLPPPTIIGKQPGEEYEVLWEIITGQLQLKQMRQVVLRDTEGNYHQVLIPADKINTTEALETLLTEKNLGKAELVSFFSDSEEDARLIETLCGDRTGDREWNLNPALREGQTIEVLMVANISERYWRAVAKIGFHFFLTHFTVFTGLEGEFDAIKRFIYNGGDHRPYVFSTTEQFAAEFKMGGRLKMWGHLLTAQYDYQRAEARMQFFAGPHHLPLVWGVRIGRSPSRLHHSQSKGFAYLYFDELDGEYHGAMNEITPNARIYLVPATAIATAKRHR